MDMPKIDKRMIANGLEPFEPTHPGELLRDEIEYRHISQKQLAADMGVSYTVLNDIVNGKRSVNTKFAILCEAALGIPAHVLTGLQLEYDIYTIKKDAKFTRRLSKVRRIPVQEFQNTHLTPAQGRHQKPRTLPKS